MAGILLLVGVLLIFLSYIPGCKELFRAGVGVGLLALGWSLVTSLG